MTFVKNRIGCPEKAKKGIGFEAKTELRQGLLGLIEWRESHKAEVEKRRQEAGITE